MTVKAQIYDNLTQPERRILREKYADHQEGRCWYCGEKLEAQPRKRRPINKEIFPPTMFKYPVHLHHDKKTGLTVGAVHAYCNAFMWQYEGV